MKKPKDHSLWNVRLKILKKRGGGFIFRAAENRVEFC